MLPLPTSSGPNATRKSRDTISNSKHVCMIKMFSTEHAARMQWHAARSTDKNSRVEQISTFPLKTIYLVMRTHDLYVEV